MRCLYQLLFCQYRILSKVSILHIICMNNFSTLYFSRKKQTKTLLKMHSFDNNFSDMVSLTNVKTEMLSRFLCIFCCFFFKRKKMLNKLLSNAFLCDSFKWKFLKYFFCKFFFFLKVYSFYCSFALYVYFLCIQNKKIFEEKN